ncbi:MAG: VOC family protein [Candidatus Eisenbacteria bacterium]|nr:VOC family protein [Candidatus Eisenbacteria bacterium]
MSAAGNPAGWFEIPVHEMARAKVFYQQLLGVQLEEHQMGSSRMAWFPMKQGAAGAAGSLVQGEGYEPSDRGVLIYFTAPDLDAALTRAREGGGEVIVGRTDIGEFGFFGLILDTEGNRVGLHSRE